MISRIPTGRINFRKKIDFSSTLLFSDGKYLSIAEGNPKEIS